MLKYLIVMIMMFVFAVPANASAVELGYSPVTHDMGSGVLANSNSIKMGRISCGGYQPTKLATEQPGYSKVVLTTSPLAVGVSGGGTIGAIRS